MIDKFSNVVKKQEEKEEFLPRKWFWIAAKLKELGIAEKHVKTCCEFDVFLKDNYSEYTTDWVNEFVDMEEEYHALATKAEKMEYLLSEVICDSNYCTACAGVVMDGRKGCDGCLFDKRFGNCGEDNSDYGLLLGWLAEILDTEEF